jgi:phosphoglycolate phosphatase
VAAYRERYAAESVRETTAYPGVADAVGHLARRTPLAVATSKPVAFAEPLLRALGVRERFAVVAGPDLGLVSEDKAQTVARALAALGRPRRAVMIGDRSYDVAGAHANRIAVVGVTWGFGSRHELEAAGAEVIIDAPDDLVGAVEGLLWGDRSD